MKPMKQYTALGTSHEQKQVFRTDRNQITNMDVRIIFKVIWLPVLNKQSGLPIKVFFILMKQTERTIVVATNCQIMILVNA